MSQTQPAPPCTYLLADHLDAVLAAGEDLLSVAYVPGAAASESEGALAACYAQRMAIERIRGLEALILARVMKARERAHELFALDGRFKSVVNLFLGGTAVLVDAIEESADATDNDFESGDGIIAFLRGRQLIAADAIYLAEDDPIRVADHMLLLRRVPLGAALDLVAAFLDTLEIHYDLYAADDSDDDADASAAA